MTYESGDTLICIDNNKGNMDLTIGKRYVVEKYNQREKGVLVTTDSGNTGTFYYAHRFRTCSDDLPEELFEL